MNQVAMNILNKVYSMDNFMLSQWAYGTLEKDKFDIMEKKVFFTVESMSGTNRNRK